MYTIPDNWITNVPAIDQEHENLFQKLMTCREILSKGDQSFQTHYDDFLKDLLQHFENEDAYMRKVDYPGVEVHAKHHRILYDELKNIPAQADLGAKRIDHAIKVLFEDIVHDDLYFSEFLRSQKTK